jgi:hypothetical protein
LSFDRCVKRFDPLSFVSRRIELLIGEFPAGIEYPDRIL